MNNIQKNYFEESILNFGTCSNSNCKIYLSSFLTEKTTRCPICDEPSELPFSLSPTINKTHSKNIFRRYFPKEIINLYKDQLKSGENIGNTPLSTNKNISTWVEVENLHFKQEYKNPSGSFKDRGSWMAVALIKARLKKEKIDNNFILGTVSTGNMAISTAFIINQINNLDNFRIKSFVVVCKTTPHKKIEAVSKAAGKSGTIMFVVGGEYSKFHKQIYEVTKSLRESGTSIFAELTDDIFRISGYATLFAEIIEQAKESTPDFIVLPIGSGALFRVAVWALESLFIKGFIKKIPRLVLVQEKGGDPITYALENNLPTVEVIPVRKGVVADAIAVANSRSGNPVLRALRKGHHIGISVSSNQILEAQNVLNENGYFVEEASCAPLAAVKKLRQTGKISSTDNVVCVLTGGDIKKRDLGVISSNTKIINCKFPELKEKFFQEFNTKKEDNIFSYFT